VFIAFHNKDASRTFFLKRGTEGVRVRCASGGFYVPNKIKAPPRKKGHRTPYIRGGGSDPGRQKFQKKMISPETPKNRGHRTPYTRGGGCDNWKNGPNHQAGVGKTNLRVHS